MGAVKRPADGPGKVLIIGGGIANFTDVAKTFTGIIRALREEVAVLLEHRVSVWVRRGGPNYQEGLAKMADVGKALGVPMHVYGPETHITAIVPLALGVEEEGTGGAAAGGAEAGAAGAPRTGTGSPRPVAFGGAGTGVSPSRAAAAPPPLPLDVDSQIERVLEVPGEARGGVEARPAALIDPLPPPPPPPPPPLPSADVASAALFHPGTRAVVYGMQQRAVQGMLDFDWLCKRATPSVAAMVFPFSGEGGWEDGGWGGRTGRSPCPLQATTT